MSDALERYLATLESMHPDEVLQGRIDLIRANLRAVRAHMVASDIEAASDSDKLRTVADLVASYAVEKGLTSRELEKWLRTFANELEDDDWVPLDVVEDAVIDWWTMWNKAETGPAQLAGLLARIRTAVGVK